jgi:hypothetical protein
VTPALKQLIEALMLGNAALFVFGALQHAGIAVGPFHEPLIVPASIVETLCALALIWGAGAILTGSQQARRAALIGNVVAITGVAIGVVALGLGAGPRTASNDLYHGIMVTLAVVSLVALNVRAGQSALKLP